MGGLGRGTGDRERMAVEHRAFYTEGLRAPQLASDHTVLEDGELRITVVPPDASEEQYRRAAWINERGWRGMPYDSSPYPTSLEVRVQRRVYAFLAHVSDRLVGVVLTSCRTTVVAGAWVGEGRCFRPERMYVTARGWLTVGFAWAYEEHRGGGLVSRMLREIATLTGATSPATFAWEPPFSPDGRKLIDRFKPDPLFVFLPRLYLPCEDAERLASASGVEL